DGIDLPFTSLGLELGDEYAVTVNGFVDEEETPGSGDQAVIQIPSGNYPVVGSADFVPGEEFTIEGSGAWTDEEHAAFRIQSSWVEGGRDSEISFYVTEVLVEKTGEGDVPGEPGEEPSDPAEEFTVIDFEDQTFGGFEGRNGGEELVITDSENHTPEGQYSLHVSNRQNDWHGPSLEVTPYINTGETYEVSAWVKVDTETAQTITLSTQVGEASPTYNNIASTTLSAEDGWVEIAGEYRYTSLGGGFVSIYLESSNVNLDFYIDDVNFNQIDSDPIDVDLSLTPIQSVYDNHFTIGNIVSSQDLESPRVDLLNHHHSLVTAENAMKPGEVYDGREFDFSGVNALVERVENENLDLHGHVLVWHSQSPDWHHTENGAPLSREEALENMHTHIRTVMENFDEIRSWDVVNEALGGSWQNPEDWVSNLRNTGWLRAIGEDYIYEAFSYARQ
ncbi:MAG: endo-1,4-beta-xylanase, partial [Alkalibacterium sp.]